MWQFALRNTRHLGERLQFTKTLLQKKTTETAFIQRGAAYLKPTRCGCGKPTNFSSKFQSNYKLVEAARRTLHTSNRRQANPLMIIFLKSGTKMFLKSFSVVLGRTFRKLHHRLPDHVKALLTRRKLGVVFIALPGVGLVSYYSYQHYDTCPVTNRKRWIALTYDQMMALSELDLEQIKREFNGYFLPETDRVYQKCLQIVSSIVESNQDMEQVRNIQWRLNVIRDDDMNNAFVLPNGEIFIFTGMINVLDSDQELAMVVGHEMAHAILGHTQEQQSFIAFSELLLIPVLAFIWFIFDDLVAIIAHSAQQFIYPLVFELGFSLPYSRQLEAEADAVGLKLATKACFDPRYSVLLWEKMALKHAAEVYDGDASADLEYLSTHPSHESRAISLESDLPSALNLRECSNCPKLPTSNPLVRAHKIRQLADNLRTRTELKRRINELQQLVESDKSSAELKLEAERNIRLLQHQQQTLEREFQLVTAQVEGVNVASLQWWLQAVTHLFQTGGYSRMSLLNALTSVGEPPTSVAVAEEEEVVCCDDGDEAPSCIPCQDKQNAK